MLTLFKRRWILGLWCLLPAVGVGQSFPTKSFTELELSGDRHSTADKKFVLQEIRGELPILICNASPEVAASINNYLFESLVAEDLEGVYGDEEEVSEESAADDAPEGDTSSLNSAELLIYGELDFYGISKGKTLLGITIFYEGKNRLYTERNHYLFDAATGAPISFDGLSKWLMVSTEKLQQTVAEAYKIAVDEALKQPCLVEHTDMAGLLKLNQQLRSADFLADEFVRSVPVYLDKSQLVFDRPVLPDAYKACDPMGVIIPLKP